MSLEAKLLSLSRSNRIDIQRLRKKVAFERLLARLFSSPPHPWVLKGGYALEIRFDQSRSTKDIDIASLQDCNSDIHEIRRVLAEKLTVSAKRDLDDYFVFEVGKPKKDLECPPYGGLRFSVKAFVDDRLFEQFQLDVSTGIIVNETEEQEGLDWLEDYNISAPMVQVISTPQHFAEKLHAYTFPGNNSRVRDLVDMVLLITRGKILPHEIKNSIQRIFSFRATHAVPELLPQPPSDWAYKYEKLSAECAIEMDIDQAFNLLSERINPILRTLLKEIGVGKHC